MAYILSIALLFLATAQALGAYIVNSGMTKASLGVSALGSDQRLLNMLYHQTNGNPRVMYGFSGEGVMSQIWDVDLSNSVSRVRSVCMGIPPILAHVPTGVDSVVLGTGSGAFVNFMWEYFPATGATNLIAPCSGLQYYSGVLGSDGDVIMGLYGYTTNATKVETYNPSTQVHTAWGQIDPAQTNNAYVYYVGGDSTAIYGAIRLLSGSVAYLGIVQKSDGAKVLYWKDSATTFVEVRQSTNNGNWYAVQTTNGVGKYFLLNGTNEPTLLGGNPGGLTAFNRLSGANDDVDTWESQEGWEVQPEFSVVQIAGSIPQASMRWRKTGETDWTSIVETNGWLIGPYMIPKLVAYSPSQLIWTADAYGPIGYINPEGTMSLVASQAGLSWYDVLVSAANDVYLAGYHNVTKRWNPLSPWTYSIAVDPTDTNINPFAIFYNTLGKYDYYLAKAGNGKIYVGSHHERGTSGGELGWYDPSDGTTGEERTTFLSYDVADLKPAVSGTKMVYVSSASDGKVFVWDVAGNTVDTSFSPLGAVVLDKVVEYESGKLAGITGTRTFAFTTAGALLWTNLLPATAWTSMASYDHRITLGPDGYLWQCAGGNLYRISTADGSYASLLSTSTDFNTVFLGNDLYLYGGVQGTNIWKVNALISRADIRTTTLKAGSIKGIP